MNLAPPNAPPLLLTYCMNIHPGEGWQDQLDAARGCAVGLRKALCPGKPFGLGLRFSAKAVGELRSLPGQPEAFRSEMEALGLFAFTLNGFPYGAFHGTAVKERVYAPDWRTVERLDYTRQLADLLAALLPENEPGSISTVPGSYKPWIEKGADEDRMAELLAEAVAHLVRLRGETGRDISLGLEPEPECYLETTPETLRFFKDLLWRKGAQHLARLSGTSLKRAEEAMRHHLGVCLDTCHTLIQFEDPAEALDTYRREGLRISKIQLSAALAAPNTSEAREALRAFDEPVYFHQVKARRPTGTVKGWTDLGQALAELPSLPAATDLRVHFHVPLFWPGGDVLRSTADGLSASFFGQLQDGICPHLEIETYTFGVLPPSLRQPSLEASILREYRWVLERFAPPPPG